MSDIKEKFDKCDDNYLKFELVENKKSIRPDLHAFLLLNELFPRDRDIVCGATHDEIWLDVDSEEINTISDEVVLELVRCGVMFGDDGLYMFV